MPLISRLGAASSRGFGEFNQQAQGNYIEDYFSTYLYTGNASTQTISNGVALADTASWSAYTLSGYDNYAGGITTDSSGNFYVVGNPVDLSGNAYIIIAKYNSTGVLQWQRSLTQFYGYGRGVAVDSSGNVYVTGWYNDNTYNYIITAKYNSSGSLQWQRRVRQNGGANGYGIVVDSSNNIVVVGKANDGTNDYVITIKYDSTGALQWKRKLQQNDSNGYAIGTDTSNNIYVTGYCNNGTNNYIIIAKYDSTGAIQWQRNLKHTSNAIGYGIAADSSSNSYVIGQAYDGTRNYAIIAKYNSSGTIQWQRKLYESGATGNAICVDSSSNCYVTGNATDSGGNGYMFVAKYNSSGTIQWQRKLQSSANAANGKGISVDASGNVYAVGQATFDNVNNTIVTAKLKADGTTVSGQAFLYMVPNTLTDAAGAATDSAAGATDSASSATDSAGTATDSAAVTTPSSATQAAATGAGGLVWMKCRNGATNHALYDTARGATFDLVSNSTAAQTTQTTGLTAFSASGFSIGSLASINTNAATYASWTFRKQPKFFDIVTYTGDGVTGRNVAHNLTSTPGFIIVKRTDATADWKTFSTSTGDQMALNLTAAPGPTAWAGGVINSCTSTTFQLGDYGGSLSAVNASGGTYVAYLFASNAGGFGADGSQNVISCGSFTKTSTVNSINLGYEPQFIIVKRTDATQNWWIIDIMRGSSLTSSLGLSPNTSSVETDFGSTGIYPTATGFDVGGAFGTSASYIYMAIRRGPMRTPTDATKVYAPVAYTATNVDGRLISSGFPVDSAIIDPRNGYSTPGGPNWFSRLTGNGYFLQTASTNTESNGNSNSNGIMGQDGITVSRNGTNVWSNVGSNTYISWFLARAPGFFDVVCSSGVSNIPHNLTVAPELIIQKSRNTSVNWYVNQGTVNSIYNFGSLNSSSGFTNAWGYSGTPIILANATTILSPAYSGGGSTSVFYLFASCPGVSKVGTYTGTGTTQTISCGFTGGARYVLIKRTDSTGDWYIWDSARGMIAGTDPSLLLNSTAAEVNANSIYTTTGGFQIVSTAADINASGGTYLYLAIA